MNPALCRFIVLASVVALFSDIWLSAYALADASEHAWYITPTIFTAIVIGIMAIIAGIIGVVKHNSAR